MKEKELKKLLDSMSVHDKLRQCWQIMGSKLDQSGILTGGSDTTQKNDLADIYRVGSTLNLFGNEKIRKIQEEHLKNDPNKIPMLFMADIIQGYSTILPKPLAFACSFDTDLVKKAYRMVGKESAMSGLHISFFPMMDLSRDPRWGRVMEGAGEDPYLDSRMCKAIVEGFQGDGLDKKDTLGACVKHFAAYGAAEGGRDYNTVNLGERALRQYYLPGYKGGVDAGASMVMTSYNTVDGIPSNCNKHLVRDILKGEWGFDGVVITDLFASQSMASHGIGLEADSNNYQYRGKISIEAGIDIDMGAKTFLELEELVENGELDEAIVDDACWRVLKLKNKLGLFENPYRIATQEECEKYLLCDENLEIAKKLAIESCVLLKNEDQALPLNKESGKIAFIGPLFDYDKYYGGWVLNSSGKVLPTLKEKIESLNPDNDFIFAKGCSFLGREQKNESERFGYCDEDTREQTISEAVEIAKKADTVVLGIGELTNMSGEAESRSNIRIPDVQLELFRRVREVNENVIVLLTNGRPLDLTEIQDAKAILDVWSLGTEMCDAINDVIFGKVSPSGKITMSFPRNVNQIPVYYNHLRTDHRTRPYWSEYIDDSSSEPLYPFGFGLTYSDITYGETTVDKDHFGVNDTVTASVEITNNGKYDVTEIAELYMQDAMATVSLPVKELKGFKRVDIKAGETVRVEFAIKEDMLRYYNFDMEYTSDSGKFGVLIAHDSRFKESEFKNIYLKK